MAVNFSDLVKQNGSVSAALTALGNTKGADGVWRSNGSSSSGGSTSTSGSSSSSYSKQQGSSGSTSNANSYAGTNYHQDAINAAARGDWDAVNTALTNRQNKIDNTGGNDYGISNEKILADLQRQYGYGDQTPLIKIPNGQDYGTNGYGSFEDFLSGTGYDQYAAETQAAIKAAVEKAINGYRDQIDTTNKDSDELARQAYIAKMLGQKNLDQKLSANGYAGGMADSQRIATETSYQNQLNELEKQRQATVKELESAITNAQLTGDMQTAQELASYLQQIQGQWANYIQNQKQMEQENYWNQKQLDNQNYWNQQNLDMQTTENNRSWVLQQLANGIMPDDDTLAAAGITKQAAQQQVALALAKGKQKTGGGYDNGSLTRSQVEELQKALGVTEDGLWGSESKKAAAGMTADQAWEAYQGQNAGTSRFGFLYYKTLIQNKQYDAADEYLAKYWDTMSDTDRGRVNLIIKNYGPK